MRTIIDLLEKNALEFPEKVCLTEKDIVITWKDFNETSNKLANWLIGKGVKKGDKIALIMKNCIDWLPIYFGILKAGAVAVPINYNYDASEMKYCIEISECSSIICSRDFVKEVEFIRSRISTVKIIVFTCNQVDSFGEDYSEILSESSCSNPGIVLSSDDMSAIYFSSGTTGFPKAILLNHKSLLSSAITEQRHHSQTVNDIFLIIAPLYHTGAKMHWFGNLLVGGSAVILNNSLPDVILNTISDKKITIAWLLLPWVQDIIEGIRSEYISLDSYDLSSWRLMHMGAQPIPPQTIREWHKIFPGQQFDISYGLTEAAGPGCVNLGVDNYDKINSIGKSGFGWRTEILSDNKVVPPNVEGELIVMGDGVMVGYYKDSVSTNDIFHNGWLRTGDMAYKDADGYIYLIGRKKDIIISGGENIYPIQIENFIREHPAVKDAAVIGAPNKRLGEVIAAVIELKPDYSCTKSEMNKFCEGLPMYKRPYKIYFMQIPRNGTGKIDKCKLREELFNISP